MLVDRRPDVLVTTLRLQEYNGIHLAITSRLRSALTKTIVIGYGDPVLAAEAREAGAIYLTDPGPDDILAAVDNAAHRPERKWPRARANIVARAAQHTVRLVDLSYGGFRMELAPGAALPSSDGFDLTVGALRVPASTVWVKQDGHDERVWCGATVAVNGEADLAWRALVDGVLSGQLEA